MDTPHHSAVQALLDRAAITDIVHAYSTAVDERRWSALGDMFHGDAEYWMAGAPTPIATFIASMEPGSIALLKTEHHISNIRIDLAGDSASVTCYLLAYHLVAGNGPDNPVFPSRDDDYACIIGGEYHDVFSRRADVWRIQRRELYFNWRWEGEPTHNNPMFDRQAPTKAGASS